MPIRLTNSAEGGTAGQAITVGTASSTGALSGAAFNVNRGTNSTITFTSQAAHGSVAYDLNIAAGEAAYLQWDTGDATSSLALRAYWTFDTAVPATTQEIMSARPLSGQTVSLCIMPAGTLRILSSTGATLATGTAVLQVGTTYRLELLATADPDGDATPEGSVTATAYLGDTMTVVDTLSATNTAGTGTGLPQVARFGRSGANTQAWRYRFDDLAAQTGAAAFIGPFSTDANPTFATLAAEAGMLVLLTGSNTETGTWTQTAGAPTVTLAGDPVNATFDAPVLLDDTTLTFKRGTVTATVTVQKAAKRRLTSSGIRPVLTTRVTELETKPDPGPPDETVLLPVSNLRGFQVPGTRHSRLEWTDLNAPRAASYFIRETTGGLSTSVTTQFRESGNLAVGDYIYTVTPANESGATGPATSVQVSIVSTTAAPTITSTAPVVGTRTWSSAHTVSPAVTVVGELRRIVDGPVVATYSLTTAGTSFTESYANLEPGTQYIRTTTFTRADNGAVAVQSGAFTTQQAAATVKYERLAPVLASDDAPLPADAKAAGWRKVRVLSGTTYTVDDGPTLSYSGGITMPGGTSNLILLPRNIALKQIGLYNGVHMAVRGGEVDRSGIWTDAQYYETTGVSISQSARKGMQLLNFTGHCEVEGVYIHGAQILDAIWINTNANSIPLGQKRYFTFQNCWLLAHHPTMDAQKGLGTWADNELHADAIQLIGGEPKQPDGTTIPNRTVLRLYNTILESALQGVMDTYGFGIELELENVQVNMTMFNDDGTRAPAYPFFWGGGAVRVGPNTAIRHANEDFTRSGYPHTPKWDPIDFSHGDRVDPPWRTTAWAGTKNPGRSYIAT